MSYETIVKEGNFYQTTTADYGFRLLTNGTASDPSDSFRSVQALEDSVITTTTTVGDALTSLSISEGTIVYGKFDTVRCDGGKVIAYKAS